MVSQFSLLRLFGMNNLNTASAFRGTPRSWKTYHLFGRSSDVRKGE